jgi:hypothetical protein
VTVASIKWRDSSPSVEIPGLFERIKAGRWLALAPGNRSVLEFPWCAHFLQDFYATEYWCRPDSQRFMIIHGRQFSWVPKRNTVNVSVQIYYHCSNESHVLLLVVRWQPDKTS